MERADLTGVPGFRILWADVIPSADNQSKEKRNRLGMNT